MNTFDSAIFLENIEWFDETGQELVQEQTMLSVAGAVLHFGHNL